MNVLNLLVALAILCLSGGMAFASETSLSDAPPATQVTAQAQRDERIKYTVEERLRTDGRIDWRVLDVEVSKGNVTLYGEVETDDQKGIATLIASSVPEVTEINNRIIVDVPPSKDHNLQKAVWETLESVDVLQTDPLRVHVKNGVVTLSGMVERSMQKVAAEKAVESVSGVKKVINVIHIGPLPFQTEQATLRKENREPLP